MTGRITLFTKELAEAICLRLANGDSLRTICLDADMPDRGTITTWVIRGEADEEPYADFSRQYARAREAQMESHVDDIVDISDDATIPSDERRVKIDSRKWAASKLRYKKYGDKLDLNHGGQKDNPIEISDAKVALLRGLVPNAVSDGADKAD